MSATYIKLFNMFKEITDAARSAVSRHILPLLEGARVKGENDAHLLELYTEWQATCRAAASAVQHGPYPNELLPMPTMPTDDDEHTPCRQMAAVLIERNIYNEFTAQRWFYAAAMVILANPACANHSKSCACQLALEGWAYDDNLKTVNQLKTFYAEHYDMEKDTAYIAMVRDDAAKSGITFEKQMERNRVEKEHAKRRAVKNAAKKDELLKLTHDCVFICYQDLNEADLKAYNLHGYYKVTKTAECYEFMLVETPLQHPDWRQAVAEKKVTKVPLTKMMGVRNTSFQEVTADRIHTV